MTRNSEVPGVGALFPTLDGYSVTLLRKTDTLFPVSRVLWGPGGDRMAWVSGAGGPCSARPGRILARARGPPSLSTGPGLRARGPTSLCPQAGAPGSQRRHLAGGRQGRQDLEGRFLETELQPLALAEKAGRGADALWPLLRSMPIPQGSLLALASSPVLGTDTFKNKKVGIYS